MPFFLITTILNTLNVNNKKKKILFMLCNRATQYYQTALVLAYNDNFKLYITRL